MKIKFIIGAIITIMVAPIVLYAQTSIGFSTRNYALMPSETVQDIHIPISSIDVSYGLEINRRNVYKDIDIQLYTGIYLAQLGFFHENTTIGFAVQNKSGRRHFIDIGLATIKEIYSLSRFKLNAKFGIQYLISLQNSDYESSSLHSTTNLLTLTTRDYNINFSTNRNPHNLFLNYGLDLSYNFKRLPISLSTIFSYRDYLGKNFTNQTILDLKDTGIEKYNITSTGNALEYSFSLTFNFK